MYYTKHAQARFAERFPHLMTNPSVLVSLHACFTKAEIDRRSKNNTAYLVYLAERYGGYDFDFYINGDVLFVCKADALITVMDRGDVGSSAYRLHGEDKSRFNKRHMKTATA